jgi:hypothetical protein
LPSSYPVWTRRSSKTSCFRWRLRDRLGSWFGLGRISVPIDPDGDDVAGNLPIPGTKETSLTEGLPDDLRNTAADLHFASVPFAPLYRTDVEFAAELSNRTVHDVMHLAWVDQGEGRYQGQMAARQATRSAREGLHGAHQAVPVLGRIPRDDARDRTSVAETRPAVGRVHWGQALHH